MSDRRDGPARADLDETLRGLLTGVGAGLVIWAAAILLVRAFR